MDTIEIQVTCPHCGEPFASFVDPSEETQTYTEDCYICCHPIQLTVTCADEQVISIEAEKE